MVVAYPPANKGKTARPLHYEDDDGFASDVGHDVIKLLEENARLRTLVTQLSRLVLKQVVDKN
jgi:hypothetical protein